MHDTQAGTLTTTSHVPSPPVPNHNHLIGVLDGMEVLLDCATSGPVTALAIYAGKGASMPGAVVYGTRDGAVGLVDIEEDTVRKLWRNGESEVRVVGGGEKKNRV